MQQFWPAALTEPFSAASESRLFAQNDQADGLYLITHGGVAEIAMIFSDCEGKMAGGHCSGTLVASELLTHHVFIWVEVPKYAALLVDGTETPSRRIEMIDC